MLESVLNEIRKSSPIERINKLNRLLEQKLSKEEREKVLEEIKRTELEIQGLKLWKLRGDMSPISRKGRTENLEERKEEVRKPREERLEEIASSTIKKAEEQSNNTNLGLYKVVQQKSEPIQNLYGLSKSSQSESMNSSNYQLEKPEESNPYKPKREAESERKEEKENLNRRESILENIKKYRR